MIATQRVGEPTALPGAEPRHRRHVCVVTETYAPEINGVALTLGHLVEGLRARGHAVSIVRPRQRTADPGAGFHDPALTLVRGVPLPGYEALRFGLPAGARLRARWSTRPPDVVYVATEGPLGWSAVRAARRLGIPVLGGFHTNFHGYVRHYRAGWLRQGVARYLRRFHNRTDGTLVPTAELRDQLRSAGFRNLSVLGRGVDGRLFTPGRRSAALRRAWGVSESDLVLAYVGRIAPEKNVELAVRAYHATRRIAPSTRFVVVGDGPSRPALQEALPGVLYRGELTGERSPRPAGRDAGAHPQLPSVHHRGDPAVPPASRFRGCERAAPRAGRLPGQSHPDRGDCPQGLKDDGAGFPAPDRGCAACSIVIGGPLAGRSFPRAGGDPEGPKERPP